MKRAPLDSLDYPGDGYYYLGGNPFTGVAFTVHEDDGWLESETEYKQGLKWGLARRWSAPGQLESEAELQRGAAHGKERVWHPNGNLKEEGDYEFGITLSRKQWDEDGNLVEDFELKEADSNYGLLQTFREIEKKRTGKS